MSESDPINPERPKTTSVRRYYTNLAAAKLDYKGALLSLDRLLEELPYKSSYRIDDLNVLGAIPTDEMYELEPRIAAEELALTPLLYFGPELERSQCSLQEIADWYTDVVDGISRIAKNGHDVSCYEYDNGSLAHCMCPNSLYCPNRVMESYLGDDVRDPYFNDVVYFSNPARRHDIALIKAQIGQDSDILTKEYDDFMQQYDILFSDKFPNITITYKPTDEIPSRVAHDNEAQRDE